MRSFVLFLISLLPLSLATRVLHGQQPAATTSQTAVVAGTVTDSDGALIPGATVTLTGPSAQDTRTVTASSDGHFAINNAPAGLTVHVTVKAEGFGEWKSQDLALTSGQTLDLSPIQLSVAIVATSVSAETIEQIATEQINAEEHQRVLGIVPNFYVAYDGQFAPMTPELKYRLAWRTATDAATFGANAFLAGLDQADGASPHYRQGLAGFGQRYGASYAGTFTDVMVGAAILPSLLHQDPRYFYQGTGTKKSRLLHAVEAPFVAKGDNGRWQPNYSSIGGDLVSSSLTNLYYPRQDRGPGLVFRGALEITGTRIVNTLAQEFLLRHFTSRERGSTP
jgi:Carboxypeptidase regulatory-like domain